MSRSPAYILEASLAMLRALARGAACALFIACSAEDDSAPTPATLSDAGSGVAPLPDSSGIGMSAQGPGTPDAAVLFDAGTMLSSEAGAAAQGGCALGEATSLASDQSLDLFGNITYFAQGKQLPAGRYRVAYVDGCMKFNPVLPWSVNNAASSGWWLVGASSTERIVALPGNADNGFLSSFGGFEECVTKNQALSAKEFDFVGGKLGIWLDDGPYTDNQAGEGGRNPRWKLTLLVDKCPPELL